ncbi:DinB family protein [Dyadobacter sp. NIV53]|uniref:DinB family protein n=1 Tax=Dyadobacter sp. NIV53 TaxID=2861765 RepID=UPI001C86A30B|nr:DinB family protein [Dyadobacter sp. NIV53]
MDNTSLQSNQKEFISPFITTEAFLNHWQGHRRLTRKVIEAFPENEFYNYSLGGMRPFAEQVMEMIGLAAPGIRGIQTGNWTSIEKPILNSHTKAPETKREILNLWDWVTDQIDTIWPQIPQNRFEETDVAFGQYEDSVYSILLYLIDNEIHHRGQGYVYLRSLGIEPPAFWDRI